MGTAAILGAAWLLTQPVEPSPNDVSLGSVRLSEPSPRAFPVLGGPSAEGLALRLANAARVAPRRPVEIAFPDLPGLHLLWGRAQVNRPPGGPGDPFPVPTLTSNVAVCSEAEVFEGVQLYARGSANLGLKALDPEGEGLKVTGNGQLGLRVASSERVHLALEVVRNGWSVEQPLGTEARSMASVQISW